MKWVWLLALAACWSRPKPPTPDRTVTVGVEATSFRLDNGLRVVLIPDPRATQVSVTVQYGVGSSDDPDESEGLAHVVEHVLFEPMLDGRSLLSRLQDTAIYFNGLTGTDDTTYTARAWPGHLRDLLAIEAARLEQRCASVSDEAFLRAREIVRNELRERDASWEIFAGLDQAIFPAGHPYHRFAPTLTTIGSITREQACAFADAHYGTNNAVVIVSGPIGRAELTAALGPTLGRVRREVTSPAAATAPAIAHHSERIDVPLKSPAVAIAWPVPQDPIEEARVSTVIHMLARLIASQVDASATIVELGGSRGRSLAIVLIPSNRRERRGRARGSRARTIAELVRQRPVRGRARASVVRDGRCVRGRYRSRPLDRRAGPSRP
jgi:zinc protease